MATVETQLSNLTGSTSGITLDIRSHVIDVRKQIDSLLLELAKNLSEIYHKEYYVDWGYKTFELYVIGELDYSYRKAKYFVEIWDSVKHTDLDVSRIEAVGWSKMAEIARIMNEDNAELWLEKAEKMTVRDLNMEVRSVIDNAMPDTRPKITYMKFRLDSIDASIVNEAITESCRLNNTADVALSLAQICDEWLLSKGTLPKMSSLQSHIDFLNKAFSTNLIVSPTPEMLSKVQDELGCFNPEITKPIERESIIEELPLELANIEETPTEEPESEEDMLLSDADINALLME